MAEESDFPPEIVAIIYAEMPKIDRALSAANVAISSRAQEAFEIIQNNMIRVTDYEAFLVSEMHGKLRVIVSEWFRERYGKIADSDDEKKFDAAVLIHDTPFIMRVPKNFSIAADEPNMWWVAFPASVQKEENPIDWVQNQDLVGKLSSDARNKLRSSSLEVANLVRSTWFDLHVLTYEADKIVSDLASSIITDLKNCAINLCERSEAGLRLCLWNASQATEKGLKLSICRSGQTPPFTHDLRRLADQAEALGIAPIDRQLLEQVPSNRGATNIRYGGEVKILSAIGAYNSALHLVRNLAYHARPTGEYNVREARFKIKLPPWFDFDIDSFKLDLKAIVNKINDEECSAGFDDKQLED